MSLDLTVRVLIIVGGVFVFCAIFCGTVCYLHFSSKSHKLNLKLDEAETNIINTLEMVHNRGEKMVIKGNKVRTKINNVEHLAEVKKFKKEHKEELRRVQELNRGEVPPQRYWHEHLNMHHDLESSNYNSFID